MGVLSPRPFEWHGGEAGSLVSRGAARAQRLLSEHGHSQTAPPPLVDRGEPRPNPVAVCMPYTPARGCKAAGRTAAKPRRPPRGRAAVQQVDPFIPRLRPPLPGTATAGVASGLATRQSPWMCLARATASSRKARTASRSNQQGSTHFQIAFHATAAPDDTTASQPHLERAPESVFPDGRLDGRADRGERRLVVRVGARPDDLDLRAPSQITCLTNFGSRQQNAGYQAGAWLRDLRCRAPGACCPLPAARCWLLQLLRLPQLL
jgi:hypothetical protein